MAMMIALDLILDLTLPRASLFNIVDNTKLYKHPINGHE